MTARRGLSYISKTIAPRGATAASASASANALAAECVVLFAHANGFCKETFLPVWEELAATAAAAPRPLSRPIRLVAFDFSGHGDSPPVAGPDCDWRRVAAGDVRAMLEEISGGEGGRHCCCLGVGHSLVRLVAVGLGDGMPFWTLS